MGYYVDILNCDVYLKDISKLDEVNAKLEEKKDEVYDAKFEVEDRNSELKKASLVFTEYYIKNFKEERLLEIITPYVEEGSTLELRGEEGETWRFVFKKNEAKEEDLQSYYGDAYNHFLNTYKDIPEELKKRLREWWLARGI